MQWTWSEIIKCEPCYCVSALILFGLHGAISCYRSSNNPRCSESLEFSSATDENIQYIDYLRLYKFCPTHRDWISSYLGLESRGEFLDVGTDDVTQWNDVNEEKSGVDLALASLSDSFHFIVLHPETLQRG